MRPLLRSSPRPVARASCACAALLAGAALLVTGAAAQDDAPLLEGELPALREPAQPKAQAPEGGEAAKGDTDPQDDASESDDSQAQDGDSQTGDPKTGKRLDKDDMLAELYAHLAKAPDAERAAPIAKTIEALWLRSGSDTIALLMRRAQAALGGERNELALQLLDAVVELAPDYAEGWSRRAYVYYLQSDYERSVGDLRRALALEPNHYKALEGLARILRESGQKKSALGVYQQILRINPFLPGAKEATDELSVEVEGQKI